MLEIELRHPLLYLLCGGVHIEGILMIQVLFLSAKKGLGRFPPGSYGSARDLRKYLETKKGLFSIHEQALITTLLSRDQVTKIMYV